ncbi:RrF2 family transcriptional regulator [Gilvimarinus sp. F26214L]|uniref:RrF2 family transcriptional regulator n=1 Tax=Gilvimarinus sp. DZF01 TaxID=3461371 RepID=UPI004045B298
MRITRYTDYALRVMMYVGLKDPELATIREIANSYDISRNHLMKVVQELNNRGYLVATRGKNGGLRLKDLPENINVGRLVRDMEQDSELVECFGCSSSCVITPACELKGIFARAMDAFFHALDQYTLADLLPTAMQPQLLELLNVLTVDATGKSKSEDP